MDDERETVLYGIRGGVGSLLGRSCLAAKADEIESSASEAWRKKLRKAIATAYRFILATASSFSYDPTNQISETLPHVFIRSRLKDVPFTRRSCIISNGTATS